MEGRGKATNKRNFYRDRIRKLPRQLTAELLSLELTAYFSLLWCKNIYALHKILSYWQLISKVWIIFSSWIFFYVDYWFFINLRMTTEWAFAFLNTAVIIFCLMYCLNIPRSNQNLCKTQYPSFQNSDFGDISLHRHRKIILTFFFVWFYHCHGRRNYILHSLFIVSRPSS